VQEVRREDRASERRWKAAKPDRPAVEANADPGSDGAPRRTSPEAPFHVFSQSDEPALDPLNRMIYRVNIIILNMSETRLYF